MDLRIEDMPIDSQAIVVRLCDVEFFSSSGRSLTGTLQVRSALEAKQLICADEDGCWEDVLNRQMNDESLFAFQMDPTLFQERWNAVAGFALAWFDENLSAKIRMATVKHGLSVRGKDYLVLDPFRVMRGCIVNFIGSRMYFLREENDFWRACVNVILDGHLPCGFQGRFPDGSFLVY